jgi:peptidoglycan/LPS O-acetylase OafA/YrhL
MNIDWVVASQILLTGVASAVCTGILAFAAQKFIERWLNRSLEEFKADLQLAVSARQSWWELKKKTYSEIICNGQRHSEH